MNYLNRQIVKAWILAGVALMPLVGQAQVANDASHYFDDVVAPVLSGYCLECHSGPEPKGEFDLATRAGAMAGGQFGPVIEPGSLDESDLWAMVADDEMPPKHPLPDAEKEILREWILGGASWGTDPIDPFQYSSARRAGYDWWSLQPLEAGNFPVPEYDQWAINEIDQFVLSKLEAAELKASPRADARTLVRRLYVNLLGFPAPIEAIESLKSEPSQAAWEALIDELLESPHYGERWARHWMDVVRFGESGGFEYNTPREHAWYYRDWLIRAFNDDMPYDEFVRMQLAGDIIKPGTIEGASAVGFLVAGVHNEVLGTSDEMKRAGRQDELEEISGTVGQTFIGMTVHCARCHDHKFDPISAKEYYQFAAALDGIRHGTKTILRDPSLKDQSDALTGEIKELENELKRMVESRGELAKTSANQLISNQPVAANDTGVEYQVSLSIAPTVGQHEAQATTDGDGVAVFVVDDKHEIAATHIFNTLPWNEGENAANYQSEFFTYTGNGSGDVRFRIQPHPVNSNRFSGAVDDFVVRNDEKILFEEDFNEIEMGILGIQAHTGAKVYFAASTTQWDQVGVNVMHIEERTPDDYAFQLYAGFRTNTRPTAVTTEEQETASELALLDSNLQDLNETVFTVRPRKPGAMRVHLRGDVRTLGDAVEPGGLKAVNGLLPTFGLEDVATDSDRRLKLADWMTDRNNSLFHRVIVNRIWHYHFGRGIVDSPNDFGFNGGQPSHPELLDWLAVWFRENGYSIKKLHRLILTSAVYQQSSKVALNASHTKAVSIDQGNRLLWRQNPRRISGETLRDSVLSMAGQLNPKMYGPSYKDVRNEPVAPANYYVPIDPIGPEFNRRTIYRWHVRGRRSALLDTFDCPDPSVTTPVRSVTTTPSQALSQWNHPFMLRMAESLGARIEDETGADIDEQISHAWNLVLGREPDEEERASARELLEEYDLALLARVLFNSNELIWID